MNAPTCPTCGYPLRWFAAPHNAWGCDRCQALVPSAAQPAQVSPYAPVPAHVQDHPSQPYSPFRAPDPAAQPPASAPARSRKRLVIGLAGGGAALAGGIVAIALLRGDDAPARTRDAVIEQTFAALANGDDKALFALSEPAKTFDAVARCEKRSSSDDKDSAGDRKKRADYRDPAKIEERWRADVQQLLRRTKGAKIEVVDILTELPPPMGTKPKKRDDERDRDKDFDLDRKRYEDDEDRPERDPEFKTTTYKKGHELMKGCYAKAPFRSQQVKVVLEIKDGDREFTQRVKLMMNEVDGRWYLGTPPRLNVGLDRMVSDLEAYRDKVCKCTDAGCVEDLAEANEALDHAQYELDRDADLPKETLLKIERIQGERRKCEGTARGGPELARYKELKDQLCACKDEECGRKLETEMAALRTKVEGNLRRAGVPSYEVTSQISDIAIDASTCARKLAQTRVTLYSTWPTDGDVAGGTVVSIRGSNLTTVPRTAKVFFGTQEATTARIASNYDIVAEAPPQDAAGFVEVRVQLDPGGTITVPYGFTYREAKKAKLPAKKKPAVPAKANPFE